MANVEPIKEEEVERLSRELESFALSVRDWVEDAELLHTVAAELRRLARGWKAERANSLEQAEGHQVMYDHLRNRQLLRSLEEEKLKVNDALAHAAVLRSERDQAWREIAKLKETIGGLMVADWQEEADWL